MGALWLVWLRREADRLVGQGDGGSVCVRPVAPKVSADCGNSKDTRVSEKGKKNPRHALSAGALRPTN